MDEEKIEVAVKRKSLIIQASRLWKSVSRLREVQNQRVICVITGSGLNPEDPSLYCITLESTNLHVPFNLCSYESNVF